MAENKVAADSPTVVTILAIANISARAEMTAVK
jgi:hypothetical protein